MPAVKIVWFININNICYILKWNAGLENKENDMNIIRDVDRHQLSHLSFNGSAVDAWN